MFGTSDRFSRHVASAGTFCTYPWSCAAFGRVAPAKTSCGLSRPSRLHASDRIKSRDSFCSCSDKDVPQPCAHLHTAACKILRPSSHLPWQQMMLKLTEAQIQTSFDVSSHSATSCVLGIEPSEAFVIICWGQTKKPSSLNSPGSNRRPHPPQWPEGRS